MKDLITQKNIETVVAASGFNAPFLDGFTEASCKQFKEPAFENLTEANPEKLKDAVWQILETVCDPEVPVLSILDLGIVRDINLHNDLVEIVITPTYSGCPAMDMISMNIRLALLENGLSSIKITTILSPAWTTDWMTEAGKQKLIKYGIAAPNKKFIIAEDGVECPLCRSSNTGLVSEFGSTACKALYTCKDCLEPFDYFKCH